MEDVEVPGCSSVSKRTLALYDSSTIGVVWDQVLPLLMDGIDYLMPYLDPLDVLEAIRKDAMQLWVASDLDGPYLAMLTQFLQYPKMRTLRLVWIGGENLASCMDYVDQLTIFAKRSHCERIEVSGRVGWSRILEKHGYEFQAVSLFKDLDSITEH